jgi:hypothetical protein
MENFKSVVLLPHSHEFHWLAGDLFDGKRRATARVAVHFREDEPVESEFFVKLLGALHSVLSEHGIGDEQDFVRPDPLLDLGELLHELVVNVKASRCINQQHVMPRVPRLTQRSLTQCERLVTGGTIPDLHVDVFGDHFELVAGCRSVDVHGDHHRTMVVLREPLGELSGGCCFAGTLKSDHHDDGRRLRGEVQPHVLAAQDLDQLVMDDFDDLLTGTQALHNFLTEGLLLHGVRELFDDLEVDVGFQKGDPDFLQGFVEVLFGNAAFTFEVLKNAL